MSARKAINQLRFDEWKDFCHDQVLHFRHQYENCFHTGSPEGFRKRVAFFQKAYNTYTRINNLLFHMSLYGSLLNEEKCMSCRFDGAHRKIMAETYQQYLPHLKRLKDGWRFKDNEFLPQQ